MGKSIKRVLPYVIIIILIIYSVFISYRYSVLKKYANYQLNSAFDSLFTHIDNAQYLVDNIRKSQHPSKQNLDDVHYNYLNITNEISDIQKIEMHFTKTNKHGNLMHKLYWKRRNDFAQWNKVTDKNWYLDETKLMLNENKKVLELMKKYNSKKNFFTFDIFNNEWIKALDELDEYGKSECSANEKFVCS